MSVPTAVPSEIKSLATLSPSSNARTWSTTPHPHLPIVATACSDKSVRIYSLQNFKLESRVEGGHKRSIRSCAWKLNNSKGESVLATGSFDASAGIWRRWDDGVVDTKAAAAAGEESEVDYTRGHSAAAGGAQDEDEEDWRFAVILDGHDSEIKSLCFSPVAPLLATCSRDKSVWIWEELEDDNFETIAVLQDHEGDVKCVSWHPSEQLLASGSYDDNIRIWREDLDDWACCSLLTGHEGTVWWVQFEGQLGSRTGLWHQADSMIDSRKTLLEQREKSGPRLVSCSDDLSIRIWRRVAKDKPDPPTGQGRIPSILKNNDFEEEWVEDARLPQVHERAVYAVDWSRKSGRIVSCGSDGKIVVYEERWASRDDVMMRDSDARATDSEKDVDDKQALASWIVVAELEDAHGVFEINHVVWAPRADKERKSGDEEVIVSTGDDGEVKVWTL